MHITRVVGWKLGIVIGLCLAALFVSVMWVLSTYRTDQENRCVVKGGVLVDDVCLSRTVVID